MTNITYTNEISDEILKKENYRISANFRWLGSPLKETEELCLTVCGIERCKPDKAFGPTVRRDYHIHFILHGKGYLQINNTTYELQRGHIFATPPGVEVCYYAEHSDPWHYTWVSFSGTKAEYYMEKAGLTKEHPVRDCFIEPEEFLSLTERLLDHHQITIENELIRAALLYEIVALLVSSYANQRKTNVNHDYSPYVYVNAALDYIHHHISHAHVSDIADHIGISQAYLSRIFKEAMHISPKDYLLSYRMSEASRLLKCTKLSIQEIAKQVGYTNPFSFSQSFKKMFGISPKYYRENISDNQ